MENEPQIQGATAFLMIGTTIFLETFQAVIGWIPVVGNVFADIMSIFIFMILFFWFYMYGIKMMSLKRFGTLGLGGIIEMIPYVNLIPAWTMVVIYIIGTTKIKGLIEKNPVLSKGADLIKF